MIRKITILLCAFLFLAAFITGCGKNNGSEKGEATYEVVGPESLNDSALKSWYESSYRSEGSYSTNGPGGFKYIIISAGERPTGGYSVVIDRVLKEEGKVEVYARLKSPPGDQAVTAAITYPHVVIRVKAEEKDNVTGRLEAPVADTAKNTDSPGSYQVSGVYVGQMDNNFIEIKVDAGAQFPEKGKNTTFLLPENMRGLLAKINKDDVVTFDCFKNGSQQWELTSLNKPGLLNESGGGALKESDFAIKNEGKTIALGTWDRDLNLEVMLGRPLSEKTDQLGPGADTFTGTFIKRQVYNGLELRFMSPKDNGKSFFVERMLVTGSRYVTPRGIKTGDSYKKLLEAYTYVAPDHMASYNRENHIYSFSDGATKYLNFEVKDGIIKSITVMIEHP